MNDENHFKFISSSLKYIFPPSLKLKASTLSINKFKKIDDHLNEIVFSSEQVMPPKTRSIVSTKNRNKSSSAVLTSNYLAHIRPLKTQ